MKKVTKAIICAAGQGTRFLPMTKAMPKEMLPIIDKPIIQYVVEEVVAAGVTDIIIVGSSNKRSIEDHFDHQPELEAALRAKGKDELADRMHAVAELANFVYLRQKGPVGTATPVKNAAHLIGDEPFLALYADDFFNSEVPRSVQLVEAYHKVKAPVISLIPVEKSRASSYGVAKIETALGQGLFELSDLLEKPSSKDVPIYEGQVMASVSGYVLTSEFIPYLFSQAPDKTGEVGLAQAIGRMAKSSTVYGQLIEGTWHDAGNKEKYLEAIVDVALDDPELSDGFRDYIRGKLAE